MTTSVAKKKMYAPDGREKPPATLKAKVLSMKKQNTSPL